MREYIYCVRTTYYLYLLFYMTYCSEAAPIVLCPRFRQICGTYKHLTICNYIKHIYITCKPFVNDSSPVAPKRYEYGTQGSVVTPKNSDHVANNSPERARLASNTVAPSVAKGTDRPNYTYTLLCIFITVSE